MTLIRGGGFELPCGNELHTFATLIDLMDCCGCGCTLFFSLITVFLIASKSLSDLLTIVDVDVIVVDVVAVAEPIVLALVVDLFGSFFGFFDRDFLAGTVGAGGAIAFTSGVGVVVVLPEAFFCIARNIGKDNVLVLFKAQNCSKIVCSMHLVRRWCCGYFDNWWRRNRYHW